MTKRMACIVLLFCAVVIPATAQTFTNLFSFDGEDGSYPLSSLAQGLDGNFYGTTQLGGTGSSAFCSTGTGCGTAFKLTPEGVLTTLYDFCSQPNCTDGGEPSGVVLAPNGNFYGTTFGGGAQNRGTVFEVTPSGNLTTLYSFCSQTDCNDGSNPFTGLTLASDGNLYGATGYGGASLNNCYAGCGTIFRISPGGTFTTLYSFCLQAGCADGREPVAGLIEATDGNLYGTTYYGGTQVGWGTAYKITLHGLLTTLYAFCSQIVGNNCVDGNLPNGIIQAQNGDFYGTTQGGGTQNDGTVFKMTATGTLTTLYSFDGSKGRFPEAPLFQATDRNLYGTAASGLPDKFGTLFVVDANASVIVIHRFDGSDGCCTSSALMQSTNGTLYGTTGGGPQGSVFSLSVGLSMFVQTVTASGRIGAHVIILGNNFSNVTAVSFNGTAAAFTVVSDTEITATVPTGATSGQVTVTTPSGTLTSNKPFRVIP
jgi:uncharacterized repeat protein (TIGR03803 family)